jgi:hypothetical protein
MEGVVLSSNDITPWFVHVNVSTLVTHYASSLSQVRLELHAVGLCPKVTLSGPDAYTSLTLKLPKGNAVIKCVKDPEHLPEIL